MKNRTDAEFVRVHDEIITEFTIRGVKPKTQRLDNEASAAYEAAIRDSGMTFQLVPPDDHRRNTAEKVI